VLQLVIVRWTTEYDGLVYTFVETPTRACIYEEDKIIWWGALSEGVPPDKNVPLIVLLTFSIARRLTS
jgi:hypothetical protein